MQKKLIYIVILNLFLLVLSQALQQCSAGKGLSYSANTQIAKTGQGTQYLKIVAVDAVSKRLRTLFTNNIQLGTYTGGNNLSTQIGSDYYINSDLGFINHTENSVSASCIVVYTSSNRMQIIFDNGKQLVSLGYLDFGSLPSSPYLFVPTDQCDYLMTQEGLYKLNTQTDENFTLTVEKISLKENPAYVINENTVIASYNLQFVWDYEKKILYKLQTDQNNIVRPVDMVINLQNSTMLQNCTKSKLNYFYTINSSPNQNLIIQMICFNSKKAGTGTQPLIGSLLYLNIREDGRLVGYTQFNSIKKQHFFSRDQKYLMVGDEVGVNSQVTWQYVLLSTMRKIQNLPPKLANTRKLFPPSINNNHLYILERDLSLTEFTITNDINFLQLENYVIGNFDKAEQDFSLSGRGFFGLKFLEQCFCNIFQISETQCTLDPQLKCSSYDTAVKADCALLITNETMV